MKKIDYDLIIVGLGPVGLFAANVFGKKGWKVLAIEQYENRWPYPRAIGMDDEILRAMRSIGLASKILPRTKTIKGLQLLHKDNKVFFTTAYPKTGDFDKGPHLFYQPELEQILEVGTQRSPNVELSYSCKLSSILETGPTPIVECVSKSGENHQYSCHFLLGCDGANSSVRELLGITEKSLNYEGSILKIDAIAKDLSKFQFNHDFAQKYCSTKRAWVRMIGRDHHCRWEFQFKNEHVDPELLTDESALRYIKEAGDDIDNIELINTAFYKYRSVVQKTWRKGRVLIAGDAAHLTPPYIGQGMCGGIRDIVNLSWKLDSIKKGLHSDDLLNTYQSERAPNMTRYIRIAILIGYLFKTKLYYLLLILQYIPFLGKYGSQIDPPIPKLGKGFFSQLKLARSIFPEFIIDDSKEDIQHSDKLIGEQWSLVSFQKFDTRTLKASEELGISCIQLHSEIDKDRSMKNWFEKNKVKAVLLRPDKYIFSAGNNPEVLINDYRKTYKSYSFHSTINFQEKLSKTI